MVKTKQTAHKGTGGPMKRAKFPPKGNTGSEDLNKEKEDKPSPSKKTKKKDNEKCKKARIN